MRTTCPLVGFFKETLRCSATIIGWCWKGAEWWFLLSPSTFPCDCIHACTTIFLGFEVVVVIESTILWEFVVQVALLADPVVFILAISVFAPCQACLRIVAFGGATFASCITFPVVDLIKKAFHTPSLVGTVCLESTTTKSRNVITPGRRVLASLLWNDS